MKTFQLLVFLLFFPLAFHAQKTLTGLWIGTLSNDSTTVRKDQSFEIALTQYKEKVYGYSRSSFIVNDTLYYILKRVKGKINGDVCEIKDDEIVSFNFRGRLDKGVKVVTTFKRSQQDSSWYLMGDWKTNQTKKYYSITGKVELKEEANYDKSKIFPHLEELTMDKDVAFYASAKKTAAANQQTTSIAAATKKHESKKTAEPVLTKDVAKSDKPSSNPSAIEQNNISASETMIPAANNQESLVKKEETIQEPDLTNTSLKKPDLPASTLPSEQRKDVAGNLSRPEIKKQELAVKKIEPVAANEEADLSKTTMKKSDLITTAKATDEKKPISAPTQLPAIKVSATAAAFVQERKMVPPQVVTFKSDSLELKLYDNGEIDGDTVSLLLNGEILLARQGLKASAIKKTIYIQPGDDEVSLVLYA
ncbi:MAG TPA: hypothetical protein VFD56_08500, partial [Chitinophagaceae bacterium]|nr:hypothetical protein [Chitinophagaceae bacterium]